MNNKNLQDQAFLSNQQKGKADPPQFTGLEDESEYEEPDRDTDYTSIYREDGIEDEEFADTLFEEENEEDSASDELDLWATDADEEAPEGIEIVFENPDENQYNDQVDADYEALEVELTSPEPVDPPKAPRDGKTPGSQVLAGAADWLEDDDEALAEGEWDASGQYYEDETDPAGQAAWPLGLIAVAIIALMLVMAGGYGVIQQRSATQEEIRRLQAALATSISQEDVAQTRAALEEAGQRNQQLQAIVDTLNLENRRLTDTVAGLEAQLATQGNALVTGADTASKTTPVATTTPATDPVMEPEPEPGPESAPEPTAPVQPVKAATAAPAQPAPAVAEATVAAATSTGWFVNFASYGVEATAQNWVAKLDPSAGRAVITTGTKNGRTFYRVRVVDLPSRESADRVARELAEAHRLPKLWIGQAE